MKLLAKLIGFIVVLLMLTSCTTIIKPAPEVNRKIFIPVIYGIPNKLGIAGCPQTCKTFGCAWCYSWHAAPGYIKDVETIPMIWDETYIWDAIIGNSDWLLGFNEPDLCPPVSNQACLTPEQAVEPWHTIEMRFPEKKLVAPAPSHLNPDWLPKFREAYYKRYQQYPRFDALATHCYWWSAEQCIELTNKFLTWAKNKAWNVKEVWVTEFFIRDEKETRKFVDWLVKSSVTRWSPFVSHVDCIVDREWWNCEAWGNPSIFTSDGKLTDYGKIISNTALKTERMLWDW